MLDTLRKLQYPLQNYNTTKFYTEMATARWLLAGRQVVVGRQAGGCWQAVRWLLADRFCYGYVAIFL